MVDELVSGPCVAVEVSRQSRLAGKAAAMLIGTLCLFNTRWATVRAASASTWMQAGSNRISTAQHSSHTLEAVVLPAAPQYAFQDPAA